MHIIFTGIKSTGQPHLGNILSTIIPTIHSVNTSKNTFFILIADMHSLTQIKKAHILNMNTYKVAAAWLAFGLNTERVIFYRQSDIPIVTELAWYFKCFYPYKRLKLAHSFKDKVSYLKDINAGLLTYPALMAADILLYGADFVQVGKDQLQHIEIAREIAKRFNNKLGEIFLLPKPRITEKFMCITGTDGHKMSKSRENILSIFSTEKIIFRQIMSIKTDSLSLESKKNPEKDLVFYFYRLLASEEEIKTMSKNYLEGGYGYENAKKALYECIIQKFHQIRIKFHFLMQNKSFLDKILAVGAQKAIKVASITLTKVRKALGFKYYFD